MATAAATVAGPWLLQAKANALSASAKMKPPWQMPCPLHMSCRTVIVTVATPGSTAPSNMPSPWEARSFAYRARAAVARPRVRPLIIDAGATAHAQVPVKRGARLATKAATPSA